MGFFGIFKEAFKITFSWKKLFFQILLATILPLTILNLSDIQISDFIENHTYRDNKRARNIAHIVTKIVYGILTLLFYLLSTSCIVYAVSCFYTSKDTKFKKVIGVFPKVWGRLLVTCLLFFFILVVCTMVYLVLVLIFVARLDGNARLALIICFSIPYLIVFIYIAVVWNIAMVVSVLEKAYGITALKRSKKLIYGKIWVSIFILVALEIIFIGIIFALSLLVVDGRRALNLVGKIFVGIVCYLLMVIMFHFSLVTQAVIYFVCKAYHNEDMSNIAVHLDNSYVNLDTRGNAAPV
ncbi:hypothetical protein MKW92_036134 [Papaver armeniacum]|nr:hypothetical protein MKW92_036134 [Papaver armeniacum]